VRARSVAAGGQTSGVTVGPEAPPLMERSHQMLLVGEVMHDAAEWSRVEGGEARMGWRVVAARRCVMGAEGGGGCCSWERCERGGMGVRREQHVRWGCDVSSMSDGGAT
jgi:hypothetical protein